MSFPDLGKAAQRRRDGSWALGFRAFSPWLPGCIVSTSVKSQGIKARTGPREAAHLMVVGKQTEKGPRSHYTFDDTSAVTTSSGWAHCFPIVSPAEDLDSLRDFPDLTVSLGHSDVWSWECKSGVQRSFFYGLVTI